ncbi:MAG: SigB/SigF/SigG family RNA polymerase sigma factor [Clostridiales bacterium]|nr:SigB/SigF/SigG family RNA polymerase sigma factor [Clostridiales bacterium]
MLLSNEENIRLITEAQSGDENAKTTLINEHSPLIKSIVRHFKNKGVEYEDLFQLGCIGFLKAVKNFSTEYNVRFSTYAVPMITGEIKRFLRDDGYIKISRSTKTLAAKIAYFVRDYKAKHYTSPSVEEIAKEFSLEPQEVIFAMDSAKFPLSLYEKSEDENTLSLIDKIASKENTDDSIDKILLRQVISGLSERDKKIIILRYYRDKTQSEVARVLNVSQVQVSRLESKIIEKLKSEFGA